MLRPGLGIDAGDWTIAATDHYVGAISTSGWAANKYMTLDVSMTVLDAVIADGFHVWLKITSEDEENDVYPVEPTAGYPNAGVTWEVAQLERPQVPPSHAFLLWE